MGVGFKKIDQRSKETGFTLIELLVVISIIGILIGLSIVGLSGAKISSRDARRKSDLEMVRSALEMYRSDCGVYPSDNQISWGNSLVGTEETGSCSVDNTYLPTAPLDPQPAERTYYYHRSADSFSYILCASLETSSSYLPDYSSFCGNNCGEGVICNYKVESP